MQRLSQESAELEESADLGDTEGPEAAELEALVRRYEHRVRFFAGRVQRSFHMGSNWQDDLVSAGYWGLFKAVRNRRPDANEWQLSAYVSQRIRGAVIDAARQCIERSSHREVSVGAELHGLEGDRASGCAVDATSDNEGPEDSAARLWRHSAIDRALDTLQESEQQVMVAYMQGASMAEIADSRGVAPGTMKVRFEKTTRKLRARAPALRRILLDTEAP